MERPPIPLPEGYPNLPDDELAETVAAMIDGWRGVSGSPSDLSFAFIQLGLAEQSRREVRAATDAARRSSWIALGIAVVAVAISIIFGLLDLYGDQGRQDDQLRILTEIRDLLDG